MQRATRFGAALAAELDALMSRYANLQDELAKAYDARPWQPGTIDSLADELVAVETRLASGGPLRRYLID